MRPKFRNRFLTLAGVVVLLWFGLIVVMYPKDSDAPPSAEEVRRTIEFYQKEYQKPVDATASSEEGEYAERAVGATRGLRIDERLQAFIEQHNLQDKKTLEVGSGRGFLQDKVADYTGLD